MKESARLGIILLVFCAVSAILLAVVNGLTSPVIAANELKTTLASYEEIYGDLADSFEELDKAQLADIQSEYPEVENIFVAKKGDEVIGYGINIGGNGFGGAMTNAFGFVNEGTRIAGFRNISNGETKGFGSQMTEEPFVSSFVDRDASGEIAYSKSPQAENEILWMSGATVSTKGVTATANEAVQVFNELNK